MAAMLVRALSLVLLLSLVGCGDDRPEKIAQFEHLTQQRLTALGKLIDNGQIRNANLLKEYSQIVARQKPELSSLLTGLARDATTQGPVFTSLKKRLQQLGSSSNFVSIDQRLSEAENLYQATDSNLYNDMLSDPVNVIADLSGGSLARVNAISQEASKLANGASDFGQGSQLVGNPAYGSWNTASNGSSFWVWFGVYSLFSNYGRGPIYYNRWSVGRNYSYYNDVGRYRYTSPKQVTAQNKTFERTKKQFSRRNRRFESPYAKSRTGSTSLSRQSISTPKTSTAGYSSKGSGKFRSNYAKNSSFRDSSSRTSRGVRRGK